MTTQPYWLIREPGKEHGFAWLPGDAAKDGDAALRAWRQNADPFLLRMFDAHKSPVEAVLVEAVAT